MEVIAYKEDMVLETNGICADGKDIKKLGFVIQAIPIPENATNGDMIKVMFPNQTISCAIPITDRNGAKFYRTTINGVTDFTADWWNTPYKGVNE